jgi:penicillin-binding protein-related factor A (putative recombinase)
MASRFTNRFADRGAVAEKAVQKYLEKWEADSRDREVERLVDTKAAGRIIRAAAADFAFYCPGAFGLIEVKETKHDYRLERPKITQLPRMRRRAKAGGKCYVVILFSEIDRWRAITADDLMTFGDKGSWNLSHLPDFGSPEQVLEWINPGVFP